MSCFVMEPRALAALARGLEPVLNSGYNFAGFEAPAKLAEALQDCRDAYGYYEEKKIFTALYDLNMAAYAGRYEEEAEPAPEWPDNVPRLLKRPAYNGYYKPGADFWKYYKLLDCLNYQVCEDATYNHALTKGLIDFSHVLAAYLASNCAAYENAKWGEI